MTKLRNVLAMLVLTDYDKVVSHIYEAALVPAHWDIALTTMMDRFAPKDWHVAFVVWERLSPPSGRFIGATGVHPLAQQSYIAHFAGRQEWSVLGHRLPLGKVVHSDELVAREAFRATSFYRNFLGPWGYEHAVIGMLDRHGPDHMGIVCPGPAGGEPGLLREAITRLTPHVQRAARISRRIGEADMRAASANDMLNSSPYCAIALGPDMELLLANKMGEALVARGDALTVKQGRLFVSDSETHHQLSLMAAGNSNEHAITFTATGKSGRHLVMTALVVNAAHSDQFANKASGTALMLVGGQRLEVSESAVQALKNGFGLTAAEARLASFLIEGSGVRGYANDKGVSIEAGKYLLKNIYAKTGLSNQTELIAMLREAPLGWNTPLPPAITHKG